jgi:hypothetical protein
LKGGGRGAAARRAALAGAVVLGLAAAADGQAGVLRQCDPGRPLSAEQKDTLFRFGAIIKAELEASGAGLALVARSGLDLSRFGFRYSHAGISLKASTDSPWAVRQLYYACDEGRPRIFDQGISAFLLGTDDPATGYVSVLLLPPAEGAEVERLALDNARALQLLGTSYSANAYAFSPRYQNCNQWVAELLAAAWGRLAAGDDLRTQAQGWLRAQGYEASVFAVDSRPLMWLGSFIPWLHDDDHPADDLAQMTYRVSMPSSIEAFVHGTVPGAQRLEFCHSERQVVVRHGWTPIAPGCRPEAGDTVLVLD